jgi:hypothetical protein
MSGSSILEGFQIGSTEKVQNCNTYELNIQYLKMESIQLSLVFLRIAKCMYIEHKSFVPVWVKACFMQSKVCKPI